MPATGRFYILVRSQISSEVRGSEVSSETQRWDRRSPYVVCYPRLKASVVCGALTDDNCRARFSPRGRTEHGPGPFLLQRTMLDVEFMQLSDPGKVRGRNED